jgi:type II secretory pathway pseudopilin PulG
VVGVLGVVALSSLRGWTDSREHSGTASDVQAMLQEAQQRAVDEGHDMCVAFDIGDQSFSLYQGACGQKKKVLLRGPVRPQGSSRITSPSFNSPAGLTTGVTFAPEGKAWPGSVKVTRPGTERVWSVGVEGRTGHVSRA